MRVIDDFFTTEQMESLSAAVQAFGWKYGWHSNRKIPHSHWHHEILGPGSANTENHEEKLYKAARHNEIIPVWDHIKEKLYPDASLLRLYANQHTYGVEGYPHRDSKRIGETTLLVYMNAEWKPAWAGETVLFREGEIAKSVLPKFGRVFLFPSDMYHAARSVSRLCAEGRVTLIFKLRSAVFDKATEFLIERGADKHKHSKQTLHDHLLGVYRSLAWRGNSDDVCLAGMFHSVYGTNSFKHATAGHHERHEVREIIGETAEELAYQFSTLDRPHCFLNGEVFDRKLIAIEIANLREQGAKKHLPELQRLIRR